MGEKRQQEERLSCYDQLGVPFSLLAHIFTEVPVEMRCILIAVIKSSSAIVTLLYIFVQQRNGFFNCNGTSVTRGLGTLITILIFIGDRLILVFMKLAIEQVKYFHLSVGMDSSFVLE